VEYGNLDHKREGRFSTSALSIIELSFATNAACGKERASRKMDGAALQRDFEYDPSMLPSLATECIFEHYIEAGMRVQATLWGAQEWLAQRHLLIGSIEFCNAARRAHKRMGPLVAGMRVGPWLGIDNAPNPPTASSVTLVAGLPGPSGKTICMSALAKEYSMASCRQHDGTAECPPMAIVTIPTMFVMMFGWLQMHDPQHLSRVDNTVVISHESLSLNCQDDVVQHPMADIIRAAHSMDNVHLLLALNMDKGGGADPRVVSAADRIVIVTGPAVALNRACLVKRMAKMLGANQRALAPFIDALPAYALLILERRRGCARDEPLCHANAVIQIKPAATLSLPVA